MEAPELPDGAPPEEELPDDEELLAGAELPDEDDPDELVPDEPPVAEDGAGVFPLEPALEPADAGAAAGAVAFGAVVGLTGRWMAAGVVAVCVEPMPTTR